MSDSCMHTRTSTWFAQSRTTTSTIPGRSTCPFPGSRFDGLATTITKETHESQWHGVTINVAVCRSVGSHTLARRRTLAAAMSDCLRSLVLQLFLLGPLGLRLCHPAHSTIPSVPSTDWEHLRFLRFTWMLSFFHNNTLPSQPSRRFPFTESCFARPEGCAVLSSTCSLGEMVLCVTTPCEVV